MTKATDKAIDPADASKSRRFFGTHPISSPSPIRTQPPSPSQTKRAPRSILATSSAASSSP
jgi:hypothetical protein